MSIGSWTDLSVDSGSWYSVDSGFPHNFEFCSGSCSAANWKLRQESVHSATPVPWSPLFSSEGCGAAFFPERIKRIEDRMNHKKVSNLIGLYHVWAQESFVIYSKQLRYRGYRGENLRGFQGCPLASYMYTPGSHLACIYIFGL